MNNGNNASTRFIADIRETFVFSVDILKEMLSKVSWMNALAPIAER